MRVRLFLRIIIGLALAGLFVAGALSVSKLFALALPCGPAHGCDLVNNHPSSRWFGIPVAYIGFFGYLIIGGLAVYRAGLGPERAKPVALVGYLVSAFGALTSVILQIYSFTVIHATCRWCLTSAAIMVLLLVLHALEYGDRSSEEVPAGTGEFALTTGGLVLVALALVGFKFNMNKATYQAPIALNQGIEQTIPLVPADAHIYGDKDSPVTVIEFADLMCPVCQQDSPKIRAFVEKHPGRVRLVYRHFPLSMHPMSMVAAGFAEVAAEQGKFWDFTAALAATGENMQTPDRVFEVARSQGIDVDKAKAKLNDDNGPETQHVTRDINAANALGINQTPTFLVKVQGMTTEVYTFQTMMDELESGRYKKLVEGP